MLSDKSLILMSINHAFAGLMTLTSMNNASDNLLRKFYTFKHPPPLFYNEKNCDFVTRFESVFAITVILTKS